MEGGCHCGAIRFRVTGEPTWTGTCYCIDCRKISGTTSMAFAQFQRNALEILRGSPKKYQSSEKVLRTFCDMCSSPLSYLHEESPENVEIPIGAFDNPELVEPRTHIWTSQKLSWITIHDAFPQREE